ncbi:MAG: (2Fe-2S)-binding protein, partial [Dactylosporangium sp.]|nr:(2Fe-2S)-binding protein [Dactylosporangium sp.]
MARINVTVDGIRYADDVSPRTLLVHYLRDQLGKVGTVVG